MKVFAGQRIVKGTKHFPRKKLQRRFEEVHKDVFKEVVSWRGGERLIFGKEAPQRKILIFQFT